MRFFHKQLPPPLRVWSARRQSSRHLGRRRPFHLLAAPTPSRLAVRHRPPFPMTSAIPNPWPGLVQLAHRMYTDAAGAVASQRREFEAVIETAKQRMGLDEFHDNVLPALKVIAESLEIMGRSPAFQNWTSAEWLLGLTVLAQHNTTLRKKKTEAPRQASTHTHTPEHRELVQNLLRYVRICDAVYADTVDQFCREANLPKEAVVKAVDGSILSPKFLLLRHDAAKEIVLVIRGTASILDFMTDICLVNEPFADGQGHRGMVLAAQWLVKDVRADLVRLTHKHRGYKLVVTGHSLGAGVSALVAMLLKPSFPHVRCVAFAAPASVTQNLAIACQDYVTTVVNGDDCVPRLHQHSMVRLQEELATFDWRAALKQMVDDEVAEHATYMAQKRDEHVQAVYDAFQHLKASQRKQAKSKLAQVLETPLVSASLELTKAAFATDTPPLERLASVKQLVRKQQQQSDEMDLWDTLEATVVGLERLARAIHAPSERQALLVKSQRLLLRSASGSRVLRSSSSSLGESTDVTVEEQIQGTEGSNEDDKWSLLRQRITSVVDETTQSLKDDVERTLDDVSDSMEQLQRETEAKIEDGVVAIQNKIRSRAEAIVKETQETALGVAAIAPLVKEYQVEEQAEGTMTYGDGDGVDPNEQTGFVPEDDAEQVEEVETTLGLVTECAPPPPEVLHEPLFPPGRIVYLNRLLIADALEEDHVALEEVAHDRFSRVVLSNAMILDHLCTTYERVLQVSFQAMAVAVEAAAENNMKEEENR